MNPERKPLQGLQHLQRRVLGAWVALSVREQRLLGLAAAVLLLVAVWLWGIAPAWQAVKQGPAQEAALAQQLSQVLRTAQALETWRSQNARVVLAPAAVLERLRSESTRLGLEPYMTWPQGILDPTANAQNTTPTAGQTVRVDIAQAPALPMLQWLEGLEHMANVRVQTTKLEAQTAGVLTGHIELRIQP